MITMRLLPQELEPAGLNVQWQRGEKGKIHYLTLGAEPDLIVSTYKLPTVCPRSIADIALGRDQDPVHREGSGYVWHQRKALTISRLSLGSVIRKRLEDPSSLTAQQRLQIRFKRGFTGKEVEN